MFIQSPQYLEYLEQKRLLTVDYKSQIKLAETKIEAADLKRQMAAELLWLETHYKGL